MNIALWVVAGALGLLYVAAGTTKAVRSRDSMLKHDNLAWMNDFSPAGVKLIGVVEALGGLGLVLPQLTGIAPVLTPLAATGLALLQLGAAVVHLRRDEPKSVPTNLVLAALAAFVAIGRFAT
ncbi:DoxX family protein [Lentzea sp. NPDC060358]|uniref:DoxX family protein n=1 Tax=Lentzea sp. NPDC060358 TaxID=3347103 RepID=UPI003665110A